MYREGGEPTRRQREVLSLLAQGMSNPEIAAKLSISIKTVESHFYWLQILLGVPTVRKLTKLAVEGQWR